MTKNVWGINHGNTSIEVKRINTSYTVTIGNPIESVTEILTREELRDLFLALKRELGLAGG